MSCLSQTPPLGGLSPPQGVLQGHAAHLAEWSAKLRPKGSWGTCIPQGVITFFHTAFTAHSDVGAEAIGRRLHCVVGRLKRASAHLYGTFASKSGPMTTLSCAVASFR